MTSTVSYEFDELICKYNWDPCLDKYSGVYLFLLEAYIFRTWLYIASFRVALDGNETTLENEMLVKLIDHLEFGNAEFLVKYDFLDLDDKDTNKKAKFMNDFNNKLKRTLGEYDKDYYGAENIGAGLLAAEVTFRKGISDFYERITGKELSKEVRDMVVDACATVVNPASQIALAKAAEAVELDYKLGQLDFMTKLPAQGHHAFDGKIEVFSEKNLSFECGCGGAHLVKNSFAVIYFGSANKAVYACPENKITLNLVKATGIFSIKGLKNIDHITPNNDDEAKELMAAIKLRKKVKAG